MALERPLPLPDDQTRGFWEACRDRELHLLCCEGCGTYVHQPSAMCHACNSTQLAWKRVSGDGALYTWVVVHQAPPAYETPYVVGWIELAEQRGLRILSNVVGCPPAEVQAGMRLRVDFEVLNDEFSLPVFRPA